MRGRPFDRRSGLTALGMVLCLLAAVFAFEAKLAWFSPAGTPMAHISASKLQPADAPKLIAQALATPGDWQQLPAEVPLLLTFALVLAFAFAAFRSAMRDRLRFPASSSFSPPLFRRPPPKS